MYIRQFRLALLVIVLMHGADAQAQVSSGSRPAIGLADAPTLVALARQAIPAHPQVLAAQAAVESRSAFQQAAERSLFNPQLQLELEDSAGDLQTLGVSQTFDIAGERRARTRVASYEYEVAAGLLVVSRRQIASELLATLADYWTAIGVDELAETRIELMRTFADLTMQRQQAGDLTQVELNIANLAFSQAEIEHASAESALAGADQSLRAVVLTQVPSVWPALPEELPGIVSEQLDSEALLAQIPEIRVERANVAAAAARVDLRDRERRAKPTFGLAAGTEDDESLVNLSFSMPINVRNRFRFEVAAARAEQSVAEQRAENVETRARRRLLAATERYRLTRDAWRSWIQTGQPNLGQQTELLQRLVEAGELSTTDYLVQLNQTLDTAASAIELRRQLWLAWVEWLSAAGQIDFWLGIATEG